MILVLKTAVCTAAPLICKTSTRCPIIAWISFRIHLYVKLTQWIIKNTCLHGSFKPGGWPETTWEGKAVPAFSLLFFHGSCRLLRQYVSFANLGHVLVFTALEGALGLSVQLPEHGWGSLRFGLLLGKPYRPYEIYVPMPIVHPKMTHHCSRL